MNQDLQEGEQSAATLELTSEDDRDLHFQSGMDCIWRLTKRKQKAIHAFSMVVNSKYASRSPGLDVRGSTKDIQLAGICLRKAGGRGLILPRSR
jgi:hypothetical protein